MMMREEKPPSTMKVSDRKERKSFLPSMRNIVSRRAAKKERSPSVDETIHSCDYSPQSTSVDSTSSVTISSILLEEPAAPVVDSEASNGSTVMRASFIEKEEAQANIEKNSTAGSILPQTALRTLQHQRNDSADRLIENTTLYHQDVVMRSRLEALRAQQKLFGSNHPDVLFAMQSLGVVHCQRGEYSLAQRVFEERQRLTMTTTSRATATSMPTSVPREISVAHCYSPSN